MLLGRRGSDSTPKRTAKAPRRGGYPSQWESGVRCVPDGGKPGAVQGETASRSANAALAECERVRISSAAALDRIAGLEASLNAQEHTPH